nr:hypothetical protein [uncultured Cohaesibacter sp.]
MRAERPFRQEAGRRELVICNSVTDAIEWWSVRTEPKITRFAGSILLVSYLQSGLGNRETVGFAFSSTADCTRFIDTLAMRAVEGRTV